MCERCGFLMPGVFKPTRTQNLFEKLFMCERCGFLMPGVFKPTRTQNLFETLWRCSERCKTT